MSAVELSCGGCGGAEMRLRGVFNEGSSVVTDVQAICCGCGSVTHIRPSPARFVFDWGDPSRGEADEGILCRMPWKATQAPGSPGEDNQT